MLKVIDLYSFPFLSMSVESQADLGRVHDTEKDPGQGERNYSLIPPRLLWADGMFFGCGIAVRLNERPGLPARCRLPRILFMFSPAV